MWNKQGVVLCVNPTNLGADWLEAAAFEYTCRDDKRQDVSEDHPNNNVFMSISFSFYMF